MLAGIYADAFGLSVGLTIWRTWHAHLQDDQADVWPIKRPLQQEGQAVEASAAAKPLHACTHGLCQSSGQGDRLHLATRP